MNRLQDRIDALEAELARLREALEAAHGKTPPPPRPEPPYRQKTEDLIPLEALTGYGISPLMVAQAAALLGIWPRDFGGSIAFTSEEAERISRLASAYQRHLRWDAALEALGEAPPPPALSLARLLLLGEAARDHARALREALEASDLSPVAREGAIRALEALEGG
ncbi:MAG: hypothetical protein ACP5JV_08980 [Thermus sp.]|uniref:hypothetical protein n=1 Tax=Thermus sp. TaxID=275 RepID=UPI003D1382B8